MGDFRINIHDRISLQQDPIAEVALSNIADYGRFENTAGVSVLWDLNKVRRLSVTTITTSFRPTDHFDYLDHNSEILSGSLCFAAELDDQRRSRRSATSLPTTTRMF